MDAPRPFVHLVFCCPCLPLHGNLENLADLALDFKMLRATTLTCNSDVDFSTSQVLHNCIGPVQKETLQDAEHKCS